METTLNISQYLSESEIKEICIDEVRNQIKSFFSNEENAQRLLSNLSYHIVFNEIDKVIPESRELVINKTRQIINNIQSYSVFRDDTYGGRKSIGQSIMEEAIRNNKDMINEKVKETILNKDYSEEIWSKFQELGETFAENIYEITRLGKQLNKQ